MSAIIVISEIKEERYVAWKIPQFFQATHDIIKYKSPIPLFQKQCTLTVFPRGPLGDSSDYIIGAIFLLHPDPNISLHLYIDTEGCEGAIKSQTQEGNSIEGHYKIWTWLYERASLQPSLNEDVLQGRVVISRNEKNSKPSFTAVAACQTTFQYNTVNFSPDFQDLLLSGQKSDASIEVQGRLFKVHTLILEACSPVFSVMFGDMSEKNTSIIKVDNCDPDTFQKFLKCLYSGKVENTSPDSLIGLYKLSDKYCVSDLKRKCSELMVKELAEDTIFEVFAAAGMCNDAELKATAEEFLIKNIKTILRTETWKKMQSENPSCVAEILAKVFED